MSLKNQKLNIKNQNYDLPFVIFTFAL